MPYPTDGEVFELTIDGDAQENDPMNRTFLIYEHTAVMPWRHIGKKVSGVQTRQFKLVPLGTIDEPLSGVIEKLQSYGRIPEGQWRNAFKRTYPRADGRRTICIADPSWIDPRRGRHCYPGIYSNGDMLLNAADYPYHDDSCRWLIDVSNHIAA
ncbi:MAG: hypothetical protein WAP52_00965 [Candidatus Sungiibacteriota bacterium]